MQSSVIYNNSKDSFCQSLVGEAYSRESRQVSLSTTGSNSNCGGKSEIQDHRARNRWDIVDIVTSLVENTEGESVK